MSQNRAERINESSGSGLAPIGRAYISVVIVAGTAAVLASIYELIAVQVSPQWFILAALTVVSGSATVKLPSIPASLSVSETFVFTSVLLFGPAAGTLTVALDGLIISLWLNRRRKELHRVLFNMAAPAISIWLASRLFFYLAGIVPLSQRSANTQAFLPALLVFTVAYFLLNSSLIAFAVSLETRLPALRIWRTNFLWLSLNFLCGASVAALLTVYPRQVDLTYLGAIIPLLLVLYLTYRTSMARVEDANRHLTEVNRLHLSTIETLAMAIDAKDQVTHGHIRRVQSYAVGLAQAVGVRDGALIHAIKAASLLHDMGKLAIPEHILNKPGRLTAPEFERMKLHASIGADILSAIEFPYPVVPIVRHHHENWNGSGYPQGLSGTEIPIGARILSVVDCYDALTSDRPYRGRLSDDDALAMLRSRRGVMYDPFVVDTFLQVHRNLASLDGSESEPPPAVIAQIAGSAAKPVLEASQASSPTGQPPGDQSILPVLNVIAAQLDLEDGIPAIWSRLQQVVPARYSAWFLYDHQSDRLRADSLLGFGGAATISIPLGQGVSGWVAANRRPITNSDARLDLGHMVAELGLVPGSCMSFPLISGDSLVGVLALYAPGSGFFTKSHYRALSCLSPVLSSYARNCLDRCEAARLRDGGDQPGLPTDVDLERVLAALETGQPDRLAPYSALIVRVGQRCLSGGTNVLSARVLQLLRTTARTGDLAFRTSPAEVVTILCATDGAEADQVVAGLTARIAQDWVRCDGPSLEIGIAAEESGSKSLRETIEIARSAATSILLGDRVAPSHAAPMARTA